MRLFVAVPISEEVLGSLEACLQDVRRYWKGVRWVKKEHLHFTLKFLGETSEARIKDIEEGLRREVYPAAPFTAELISVGVFPPKGRPRVLWVGMGEGHGAMRALAGRVDDVLVSRGFSPETRSFQPHLTVGRVRSDDRSVIPPEQWASLVSVRFGSFFVNRINLVQSVLRPEGAYHTVLKTIKLGEHEINHDDT